MSLISEYYLPCILQTGCTIHYQLFIAPPLILCGHLWLPTAVVVIPCKSLFGTFDNLHLQVDCRQVSKSGNMVIYSSKGQDSYILQAGP